MVVLHPREWGLRRRKKIWLRLTAASVQCLRLSERFFHCDFCEADRHRCLASVRQPAQCKQIWTTNLVHVTTTTTNMTTTTKNKQQQTAVAGFATAAATTAVSCLIHTRGHNYKLFKPQSSLDVRKYFFANRGFLEQSSFLYCQHT